MGARVLNELNRDVPGPGIRLNKALFSSSYPPIHDFSM